ncbi:MAG TPA: hypothetical protein PK509_08605 [Catalimonadaceae bacterium]|nr:hypothetical protein [Catalimonadaceae bacterium]
MNRIVFSVLLLLVWSAACKQVPNTSVQGSSVPKDLDKHILLLDSTWRAMITSDDNKIENMNRLVRELQMIDGSNAESLNSTALEVQKLSGQRYDQKTMKFSRNIDKYDSITNQVIQKLRNESNQNPNAIKYQIVNQLFSEIQLADDSVLFYRKEYDRTVDSFNNFLKTRKKDLKKSGINVDSLQPYPVFRLLM